MFFKYSLNNFLHAKVEECIGLIFSWNNLTSPHESLNLTTTIRVKTPPTVEMVEPNQEDDKKEDSKVEQNMVRHFPFFIRNGLIQKYLQ